jgi:Flp pilus assembly pilin Flp
MKDGFVRFGGEEDGPGPIEYSLLLAIIAIGVILVMGDVRDAILAIFGSS